MSRLEECGYSREQIMDNGDIIRVYVNPEGTVMGHTSCSLTLRSTDKDSKIKMEFVKFTTPNCNVSLWLSEDNVKSKVSHTYCSLTFRSIDKDSYTTLANFSTKYLEMCKVYIDVGGIK